jgi:hypothetical protein
MSTYSDASLIYYPSGYKAGTAYSLKPTDGSGDLTFTRASSATRVNAAGLIEDVEIILPTELIVNGDFENGSTGWSLVGDFAISGGKASITSASQYSQLTSQGTNFLTSGKQYKLQVDIETLSISGSFAYRFTGGAVTPILTSQIVDGKFEATFTMPSNGYLWLQTTGSYTGLNVSIDNVSVKEVITLNIPRIDYTGGGCGKLLLEPQRTNLLTYSEDFSNASWTKQAGITATYNTTETLSPNGTYNATKFVGNGTTGVLKTSISVSGVVSRSVYLKSVTGTTTATFKEPNTNVPSPITLTITNEWQRFEMIGDNGSSLQGLQIDDITSDGIYMWGAQLEAGSYPTSYIPTTTTAVTRLADTASKTGISSLINSEEGVLYVECSALADDLTRRIITLTDGTLNKIVKIEYTNVSNQIEAVVYDGTTQCLILYTLPNSTSLNKIAFKYKVNNFALFVNGVKVGADVSGTTFTANALNKLSFDQGGSNYFYGKMQNLMVFPTALSDDDLTLLTGTLGETYFQSYALMANYLNYTIQ